MLKEYISRAVNANFEIEPLCNGSDEIGVLTDSFNDMVRQISGLLKEQYKLGYEIKDLEFQVFAVTDQSSLSLQHPGYDLLARNRQSDTRCG